MITINATGDTTLRTAGKYCPEDILVKVPDGGSSGGSENVETCTLRVHNSDGYWSAFMLVYEAFENGKIVDKIICDKVDDTTSFDYTLTDAVCGGYLFAFGYGSYDDAYSVENVSYSIGSAYHNVRFYRINAPANGYASIDFIGGD